MASVYAASMPLGATVHLHFWSRGTSQPRLDVASGPRRRRWHCAAGAAPEPCPRTRKRARPPGGLGTAEGPELGLPPPDGALSTLNGCQGLPRHSSTQRPGPLPLAGGAFEQTLRDGPGPAWQLLTHIKAGAYGLCLVVGQAGGEGEAAAVCWELAPLGAVSTLADKSRFHIEAGTCDCSWYGSTRQTRPSRPGGQGPLCHQETPPDEAKWTLERWPAQRRGQGQSWGLEVGHQLCTRGPIQPLVVPSH